MIESGCHYCPIGDMVGVQTLPFAPIVAGKEDAGYRVFNDVEVLMLAFFYKSETRWGGLCCAFRAHEREPSQAD